MRGTSQSVFVNGSFCSKGWAECLVLIILYLSSLKCSHNSDATSGKEMSDGCEGTHGSKGEGKVRRHHRRSTRTRSRQEKIGRPKLNILNVGKLLFDKEHISFGELIICWLFHDCRCVTLVIRW